MAKTYLKCSAKARVTTFGEVINVGIKVEDLAEFARTHKNERGFLNLTIAPRKDTGRFGETHSVYLDDYVKGSGKSAPSTGGSWNREAHSSPVTDDEIPF